jgi:hypothetical protein
MTRAKMMKSDQNISHREKGKSPLKLEKRVAMAG